ncbi:multiheme c-type cytochrome [Methanolobus vulcani]|nr:multiheme c-type cytochrome [Methanolobus vulcani]
MLCTISEAWQPETCKNCHLEMYEKWNASAHAESLKAAGGSVLNIEECTKCHLESSIKETWGREDVETTIEPVTCEVCHNPPAEGYDAHISEPSYYAPEVNFSAEMCGNCHRGEHHPVIEEWNEFNDTNFNITTMSSHSEPTDIAEPYILGRDKSCVSCKATDGAIPNLEDPDVFGLNLHEVPEPSDVSEWRIACVACHEPHSAGYWIEDDVLLCGNCHNSEHAAPDGQTTRVLHPQWEMYNGSIYDTGIHPIDIGCSNCHMAMQEYNDTTEESAITGHTFGFKPEILFSSNATNGCYDCHQEVFIPVVEAKQELIIGRINDLEATRINANKSLEELNGTLEYDAALTDYNNAVFYLEAVKTDGSHGIHNMEKASDYLDTSGELFDSVIERQATISEPGFELILAVIGLLTALWIVKKRK